MKKLLFFAAFTAGIFFCRLALAEDSASKLNILAEVKESCTMDFDVPKITFLIARDSFKKDAEQLRYFAVKCGLRNVYLSLNMGRNPDDEQRRLRNTSVKSAYIAYDVYRGASGEKKRWSDQGGETYRVDAADSQSGVPQPFWVVIPASSINGDTALGTYMDRLTVSIVHDEG